MASEIATQFRLLQLCSDAFWRRLCPPVLRLGDVIDTSKHPGSWQWLAAYYETW